nr:hypothetical protein BgiMline_002775 [Biomphalaria glabrata]
MTESSLLTQWRPVSPRPTSRHINGTPRQHPRHRETNESASPSKGEGRHELAIKGHCYGPQVFAHISLPSIVYCTANNRASLDLFSSDC